MVLADGRHVPDLPLDRAVVDRCRALADGVTAQVFRIRPAAHHGLHRAHRAAALWPARRGTARRAAREPRGGRLQEKGLLGRGAACWIGYALRRGATDPWASWSASSHCRRARSLSRRPRSRRCSRTCASRRAPTCRSCSPASGAGTSSKTQCRAAALQVPHRRDRQHPRRRRAGARRRPGRRGRHRGDPLDGAVAARLRAARRTTEGCSGTYATQENFRIMREALDEESRRLRRVRAPHELLLRAVHAGDRVRRGVGAARHAPQRRDVRDPLPRRT